MKKYIFFLLFCSNALLAQIQFEARTSRPTVGLNETLRVDFVMNADGDNFSPPSFEDFRVVGGPSQQVSQSWVNGKSSFNKVYSYFLMPLQRGTLTIKQATIEINGQTYKTNPIKITVTNAVEKQRDPNDVQTTAEEAIHLVAEVSKTNPYVNEPITVVYKLYCGFNVGVNNWRELGKPKYNDFWSQNIEVRQVVAEETYKGERYRYVVLKKVVLYPQKSGNLVIEPLSLDIDVQVPTNRRNIFGQVQTVQDNKRVSAGARTINVKALPEKGRPENFTGAVGALDFKVVPSKTNLKYGESLDLVVSVSGSGNLKLFDLPKPVVPAALEMYEPVRKESVNTPLSGMKGKISDTYTIVPGYKGNYTIKPLSFSYFDLSTRSYKTINSDEIVLRVLDGPGINKATPTSSGVNKREILASDQFQFIKLKTELQTTSRTDFFGSGLFYGLVLLPFLAIPLIVLVRRKKEAFDSDIAGSRTRLSSKLARKYLSEAKKQVGNKELFYVALEKAMHNFLKAKLHIETSEMSKEKIESLLLSRNAEEVTVSEFIQLTESCEFARYAPSSTGAMQHDYEKAVTIISSLEKQL